LLITNIITNINNQTINLYKMKKNFISLSLFTVFGVTSCNNDENVTNETTTSETNSFLSKPDRPGGEVNIGIIEFEWGRNSQNCEGFGLCNVKWFPGPGDPIHTPKTPTLPNIPEKHTITPTTFSTMTSSNVNEKK